jgi:pimeloyl-ACP methyl ester carboxylesterase
VLLLHGALTHPFYAQVARQVADRLDDCRLREIPDLGHLGPEISPEPVANELSWLADAATSTAGEADDG